MSNPINGMIDPLLRYAIYTCKEDIRTLLKINGAFYLINTVAFNKLIGQRNHAIENRDYEEVRRINKTFYKRGGFLAAHALISIYAIYKGIYDVNSICY